MDQPIWAARRFASAWKKLGRRQKEQIIDVILALPDLLRDSHKHSGAGLRRLHGSNYWEARLDIRWRLVMQISAEEIILFDVMNHDQVRRLR